MSCINQVRFRGNRGRSVSGRIAFGFIPSVVSSFVLFFGVPLTACSSDPSAKGGATDGATPMPSGTASPSPVPDASPSPSPSPAPPPAPSETSTPADTVNPDEDVPSATPTADDKRDALCHWDGVSSTPGPFDAWWNDALFYEVFVRSYKDSDGDGIGDLNGLRAQLDYLNDGDPDTDDDLGVTGLWLMPIFPSPSEHGYDVTDYQDIQPAYGTLEDFDALLAAAHQRGIRVLLDLPLNHSSSQHPWFVEALSGESSTRDWYVWSERDLGDAWYAGGDAYYYAVFWSEMPDLNYWSEDLRNQMASIYAFWLERGVDGFRLDGAKYLVEDGSVTENSDPTHCYYEGLRRWQSAFYPEALFLGEVWDKTATVATYLGDGSDQLPLVFDFDLSEGIIQAIQRADIDEISTPLLNRAYYYPDDRMGAPFLRNHDMDRTGSELGDLPSLKQAFALELSVAGTPFIYYGEEIGMTGARGDENNDNARRSPMQWNDGANAGFTEGEPWYPVNEDYTRINVEGQSADPDSLLSWYRTLIRLRFSEEGRALRSGEFTYLGKDDRGAYAFLRGSGDGAVLVAFNVGSDPVEAFDIDLEGLGPWDSGIDVIDGWTVDGPIDGHLVLDLDPHVTRWIRLSRDASGERRP